jgi:predicted RNA-binding protein with RPS1 domain
MVLEGVVTNVANFGAFIDIGVHQDGLAHVSALADRFVKDPREVVKVGQVVKVKVLEVDLERRRIALTLRLSQALAGEQERRPAVAPPAVRERHRPRKDRSGGRDRQDHHRKIVRGPWPMRLPGRDGTSDAGREPPKRCGWRSVFPVGEQVVLVAELFVLVVAQVVRFDFIVGAGPVFRRFDGFERQLVPGIQIQLFQLAIEVLDFDGLGVFVEGDDLEIVAGVFVAVPIADDGINVAHNRSPAEIGKWAGRRRGLALSYPGSDQRSFIIHLILNDEPPAIQP